MNTWSTCSFSSSNSSRRAKLKEMKQTSVSWPHENNLKFFLIVTLIDMFNLSMKVHHLHKLRKKKKKKGLKTIWQKRSFILKFYLQWINLPFVLFVNCHKSKTNWDFSSYSWTKWLPLLTCLCCPRAKFQEGFQHRRCLLSAPPSRRSACFQSDGAQRARTALCHWQGEALREPASEHPEGQRGKV